MKNFWKKLDRPFFCLAPMADVTDIAFRKMLAKHGKTARNKNRVVFWTEFVSADGLCNPIGRKKLLPILKYSKEEKPIVAQVFGANPENMKTACEFIVGLVFDGLDINMGCPDKAVLKQGAGSALIKTPRLAREIIQAALSGIKSSGKDIPLSVKTRVGFNREEIDTWIPELLKEDISAITIHARTKKEMSKVPANWDYVKRVVAMVKRAGKNIPVIGNGDVQNIAEAEEKAKKYGCDGVMIGRGVFGNPEFFAATGEPAAEKKLKYLVEHAKLFEKTFRQKNKETKNFDVMKKHFKAYVHGFDGAKELRVKLMEAVNAKQVCEIVKKFKTLQTQIFDS